MSDFKAKIHQTQIRLRLRPRTRWGAYSAPPYHILDLRGPTSKGADGKGVDGRGYWPEVCSVLYRGAGKRWDSRATSHPTVNEGRLCVFNFGSLP